MFFFLLFKCNCLLLLLLKELKHFHFTILLKAVCFHFKNIIINKKSLINRNTNWLIAFFNYTTCKKSYLNFISKKKIVDDQNIISHKQFNSIQNNSIQQKLYSLFGSYKLSVFWKSFCRTLIEVKYWLKQLAVCRYLIMYLVQIYFNEFSVAFVYIQM